MSQRDNGTCKSMYNAKLKIPTNKQTKKKKKKRDNWFIITRALKTTTRVSMFRFIFEMPFTCYFKKIVSTSWHCYVD